jgi:hypothetical protein
MVKLYLFILKFIFFELIFKKSQHIHFWCMIFLLVGIRVTPTADPESFVNLIFFEEIRKPWKWDPKGFVN